MRNLFVIISLVVISAAAWAQAPQKMNYQAVIRNNSDQLITNSVIGMQISILQGSATGTLVYIETQTPTTNANGLVSIEIGGGTGFDTITWANGLYYIKTETDPAGGTNYTITGSSQLLSVPFALHAKTADNGFSGDYNDLTNQPALFDGQYGSLTGTPAGNNPGDMQYWNGTSWVVIAAGLNSQILKFVNGVPTWVDGNINDLSIGDGYQGGIIAYFLQSGDPGYDANIKHGFIAAPSDLSTAEWGCQGLLLNATDLGIGTGQTNTNTIVSWCNISGIAANLCDNLVIGSYNDWYLPSKDELNLLYVNLHLQGFGGFTNTDNGDYWSSSEDFIDYSWVHRFNDGVQYMAQKSVVHNVRAIRSF